jgi:hypothetical protein
MTTPGAFPHFLFIINFLFFRIWDVELVEPQQAVNREDVKATEVAAPVDVTG